MREHLGRPYDLAGNLRFVLPIVPQDPRAWFCSEFLGGALAWYEPERYGPNGAAALIRTMYPQPADSGFFYAL